MANEFVQTMSDARVDAQSLSEFVFKPAGFKVARRLAPPIDTLQFYIDRFDATKATTDAYIATIPNIVNDAINNTAVEGGVLADTFVVVTKSEIDMIARTQREKNAETRSVLDYGAIGDGVLHRVQELYTAGSAIYNAKYTNLADVKLDYPLAVSASDSIDTIAFQQAINSNYGKRLWIPFGKYMLTSLVVENAIDIVGEIRGLTPYSYANKMAGLNFTNAVSDSYALTVFNPTSGLSGLTLDGLYLQGTLGINGIKIGNTITTDVTDLTVRNVALYNFKDTLTTSFLYSATFDGVRIQSCVNGLVSNSQSNQIMYNRCSFVSITNKALTLINSEGIVFNACDISNLSSATTPISFFQSSVTFNSCYTEYVTSPNLMEVGADSEAIKSASTVVINNPLGLDDKYIVVNGRNAYVEVTGRPRGKAQIIGSTITKPHKHSIVSGNNMDSTVGRYLIRYKGNDGFTFNKGNGATITYTSHRGFTRIKNTGVYYTGVALTQKMVVGEVYTMSYAIREGAETTASASLKLDSGASGALEVSDYNSTPDVRHVSFVATAATLFLWFGGELDIYGISVQKGNRSAVDADLFAQVDSYGRVIAYSDTMPLVGDWEPGDIVYNYLPSVDADVGWVCTAYPATFVSMGKLTLPS